jgi:hypothetical protein
MKFFARTTIAGLALAALIGSAWISIPAAAQAYPTYTTWQQGWDSHQYDHGHVMLGTVANFAPYRLTIQRRNGAQQTVDLKNGTVIYPTGATPTRDNASLSSATTAAEPSSPIGSYCARSRALVPGEL